MFPTDIGTLRVLETNTESSSQSSSRSNSSSKGEDGKRSPTVRNSQVLMTINKPVFSKLPAIHGPILSPPKSVLLHQGNKLFWRMNQTIDFRIYLAASVGTVIVRAYDSVQNHEFDPMILSWDQIVEQVSLNEAAVTAHQATLDGFDYKTPSSQGNESPGYIQVTSDPQRRKSTSDILLEMEKEAKEKEEMKAKVVSFVISRFEATKCKETGQVTVSLIKRSTDQSAIPLELQVLPLGVTLVGAGVPWNKREQEGALRRMSVEVLQSLKETNEQSRKAHETQRALQTALDVVQALGSRHLPSLQPGVSSQRKKFQQGVRKCIFKIRLQEMQASLAKSPTYHKFLSQTAQTAFGGDVKIHA